MEDLSKYWENGLTWKEQMENITEKLCLALDVLKVFLLFYFTLFYMFECFTCVYIRMYVCQLVHGPLRSEEGVRSPINHSEHLCLCWKWNQDHLEKESVF